MQVIGVFSQKGGSGKTTLGAHGGVIAAESMDVLLLDADRQESLSDWHETRVKVAGFEVPPVAPTGPSGIRDALATADEAGIDLVIIDFEPRVYMGSAQIIEVCDFVVMPVQPTRFDLQAVPAGVALVEAYKKPFAFVLNCVREQSKGRNDGAREALESYGEVCPAAISRLDAFNDALIDGRSVTEFAPGSKAADQMRAAWKWIFEKVNHERS